MRKNNAKLLFGFRGGQLLHISEVESGLRCECYCASCRAPLVAKKGELTTHHFAHYRSEECAGAVETALHLAAKQLISKHQRIKLPRVIIGFNSYRPAIEITGEFEVNLDTVALECRIGNITPDIIAYVRNVPLLIEIKVTHEVDQAKAQKIRELGISAIEIDLSKSLRDLNFEELSKAVIKDTANKRWIYNFKADSYRKVLVDSAEIKRKIFRQVGTHVDGCPINKKTWNGKSYANVHRDCFDCKFLIEIRKSDVICGGRAKIRTLRQLKLIMKRGQDSS